MGETDGILQVLITGGVSDIDDITMVPEYRERIRSFGEAALAGIESTGLRFGAGME